MYPKTLNTVFEHITFFFLFGSLVNTFFGIKSITSKVHKRLGSCVRTSSKLTLFHTNKTDNFQFRPQLFKGCIALSTGSIVIQWISVNKTNHAIRWIVIYPVDSVIQPLNNWGQNYYY